MVLDKAIAGVQNSRTREQKKKGNTAYSLDWIRIAQYRREWNRIGEELYDDDDDDFYTL